MLTPDENELLTRTAPGTPMGALMRRYWIPALLSSELPNPDCPPVRVTLLGEDLVAFRDTGGRVALLDRHCSHRGASLFFGRNEERGLRCVYHGWKYDVSGACVDMPNEPAESTFKDRIHIQAYPCQDQGGVIWTYMGPPEQTPSFPQLEWALVPENQRYASKRLQECNWLQAMEGGIDSSHISFLHGGRSAQRTEDALSPSPPSAGERGFSPREQESVGFRYRLQDTSPRFEVLETEYGLLIGARRNADQDSYYWRITQWLMPWYTMIPPFGDRGIGGHAWVPVDDQSCLAWSFSWHPIRPLTPEQFEEMRSGSGIHSDVIPGTFRPKANRDNAYLIDREVQRTQSFTGISGISAQDCAVQESMGLIYDRGAEHLGSSDMAIISARLRLLQAVRALERGVEPPALDGEVYRVRSFSTVLPRDVPFGEGAKEGLIARPGAFVASV